MLSAWSTTNPTHREHDLEGHDMHLLTRSISPYTGVDLLLGLFTNEAEAGAAATEYVATITQANDPWARQLYRAVDLSNDIAIRAVPSEFAAGVTVHGGSGKDGRPIPEKMAG